MIHYILLMYQQNSHSSAKILFLSLPEKENTCTLSKALRRNNIQAMYLLLIQDWLVEMRYI